MLAIHRATEHSAAVGLIHNHEKIYFNIHHPAARCSVYRVVYATGNDRNFDSWGGNCEGLAHSGANA